MTVTSETHPGSPEHDRQVRLSAQVELVRSGFRNGVVAPVEARIAQLEQLRTPYAARLNAELNRPAGAPLAPVAAVQDRTTDASAGTPDSMSIQIQRPARSMRGR